MLIGCNYSKELMALLRTGRVHVDAVKLGLYSIYEEGYALACSVGPVLLHGVAGSLFEHAGMSSVEEVDWTGINQAVRRFRAPHLGFHLDAKQSDWERETVGEEEVMERVLRVTCTWREKISVPLLVENVPYSAYYGSGGTLECVTEPAFIRHVCETADVGLLPDCSHARVTAWHRGIPTEEYLAQLPLDRVREIHVVGSLMTEDGLRDRHVEMDERDYETLEWVLRRTSPYAVTLEYGGPGDHFAWRSETDTLERQLKRLEAVCAK